MRMRVHKVRVSCESKQQNTIIFCVTPFPSQLETLGSTQTRSRVSASSPRGYSAQRSILRARMGAAGTARWKSGAALALHTRRSFNGGCCRGCSNREAGRSGETVVGTDLLQPWTVSGAGFGRR